jgi:hypothetical protein
MPNTISKVAPISPLLTNVAVGYQNGMFVAEDLLPVVPVAQEKFTYYRFGRSHFRRYNTKRAVSSGFQRVDYSATTATGACQEYGLEHPIDDRIRDEAQAPLEPDVNGTMIVTEGLRLDQEKRVAALLTNPSNYLSTLTSQPSTQWSTATATIHADVTTAMELIRKQIGVYPNVWMVPASVAQKISIANDITDYVKNVAGLQALMQANPEEGYLLPKRIWGLKVIIAGGIENTANLQQAETIADIWSDFSILAYVQPQPAKWKPTTGYIFRKSGAAIKIQRYRDEPIKSDIIRGSTIQVEKLLSTDNNGKLISAYLFTNVLA